MSPYLRTVKSTSGATVVQIVHSSRRGSREIEHIGSAHDEVELEALGMSRQPSTRKIREYGIVAPAGV
jgi:hypothetical protein